MCQILCKSKSLFSGLLSFWVTVKPYEWTAFVCELLLISEQRLFTMDSWHMEGLLMTLITMTAEGNKRNGEEMISQWLVSPLIILAMKANCGSQNSSGPLVWTQLRLEPVLMPTIYRQKDKDRLTRWQLKYNLQKRETEASETLERDFKPHITPTDGLVEIRDNVPVWSCQLILLIRNTSNSTTYSISHPSSYGAEAAHTWRRRKYPGVSLPSLMIMSVNVVWGGSKWREGLGWPLKTCKENGEFMK